MSDRDQDLTRDQAKSTKELLTQVWDHIDRDEEYEGDNPRDYLDAMPLELVWEKGEPFAVVLGTGGPHVEITGGGRASGTAYTLSVYWGGNTSHESGQAITRTGEYFREMVEEAG